MHVNPCWWHHGFTLNCSSSSCSFLFGLLWSVWLQECDVSCSTIHHSDFTFSNWLDNPTLHGNLQWDNCRWFRDPHWPAAFRWTWAADSTFNCPSRKASWQGLHATICHRQTARTADLTHTMWGRARLASAICHSEGPVTPVRGRRGKQYAD